MLVLLVSFHSIFFYLCINISIMVKINTGFGYTHKSTGRRFCEEPRPKEPLGLGDLNNPKDVIRPGEPGYENLKRLKLNNLPNKLLGFSIFASPSKVFSFKGLPNNPVAHVPATDDKQCIRIGCTEPVMMFMHFCAEHVNGWDGPERCPECDGDLWIPRIYRQGCGHNLEANPDGWTLRVCEINMFISLIYVFFRI